MVSILVVIIVIITRCLWFCFMAETEFGLIWIHFSSPAIWLDVFSLSCLTYIVGPRIYSRKHSSSLDLITLLEGKQVKQGDGRKSFHSSWSFCGSSTFWKLHAVLYWALITVVDHSGGNCQAIPAIRCSCCQPYLASSSSRSQGPDGCDSVASYHSSSDSVSRQNWGSAFPMRIQLSDTDILT